MNTKAYIEAFYDAYDRTAASPPAMARSSSPSR